MERDWDDEFANMAHIPGAEALPAEWSRRSEALRSVYPSKLDVPFGGSDRERLDLFLPNREPKGLVIFVHGGYWMQTSPKDWSYLAEGALKRCYAFCLPGYVLAPDASVSEITRQVGRGIGLASTLVEGPIFLAGHSAGAHLVMRQICDDSPLSAQLLGRLARVTGIGGVYDLRPLLMTRLNWTLGLSSSEAVKESPILKRPKLRLPTSIWVGAEERPEFIRQSKAFEAVWLGLGARMTLAEDEGTHHFSALEGMIDPASPLMASILGS